MSAECTTIRLGEICTLLNGRAYSQNELLPEGKYPVLRVGNLFSNKPWYYSNLELDSTKYCDAGDLLYAWSASFGPKIWPGGKVIYHYHIWKVESDEDRVTKRFLYYWFDWDSEKIRSEQGAGTTMTHVTKGSMENRRLRLPSLGEQKRIVAILDEAFAGIDAAIANTEKNLANARELFAIYLASVFTNRGEGWKERRLGDIARTQYGLSEKMNEGSLGFKIFRMGDVQYGRLIDTGEMKCVNISREEFLKYKLRPGDVLFNRTNSYELVGKTGLFDLEGDYCFASYLVRLEADRTEVVPEFLNYFMNSSVFQGSVKQKASRSVNQANINATILANEKMHLPRTVPDQIAVVRKLDLLSSESRRLQSVYQRKLACLVEAKQAILHKAFAGELTARPEKALQAAAE